jgi:hypothetical protein
VRVDMRVANLRPGADHEPGAELVDLLAALPDAKAVAVGLARPFKAAGIASDDGTEVRTDAALGEIIEDGPHRETLSPLTRSASPTVEPQSPGPDVLDTEHPICCPGIVAEDGPQHPFVRDLDSK